MPPIRLGDIPPLSVSTDLPLVDLSALTVTAPPPFPERVGFVVQSFSVEGAFSTLALNPDALTTTEAIRDRESPRSTDTPAGLEGGDSGSALAAPLSPPGK